jgi:CheY-like chemotaxis protein
MEERQIYSILKESIGALELQDSNPSKMPQEYDPKRTLQESGISLLDFPDIVRELRSRLGGRDLGLDAYLLPEEFGYFTFKRLTDAIKASEGSLVENPVVVYVDDEDENLFIFKRRFSNAFNLKTFNDPQEALEFIHANNDVALVITDEVMPRLSGNELCDALHETKPNLKCILITGNPDNDGDLMYKTLRQNRFFDFINKPLDFERKGKDYLELFQSVIRSFRK